MNDITFYATPFFNNMIYVGGAKAAQDYKLLEKAGIKGVILAAYDLPVLHSSKIAYLQVPVIDGEDPRFIDHVPLVQAFIDTMFAEGKPILIMCQEGRRRSVSYLVSWIMKTKDVSFKTAFDYVKSKHSSASINRYFEKCLTNKSQK